MKRVLTGLALACLLASAALPASITYAGSSGVLSAAATFEISGNDLIVTLNNTSTTVSGVPSAILTAVYFSLPDGVSLTPVSAKVDAGGTVVNSGGTTAASGLVVGGEWAFANVTSALIAGNTGISSSGLGLFGPSDRFPGANLEGPTNPDGVQYGIATPNYTAAQANGGLAGNSEIVGSVTFVLSGLPAGFSLSDISDVEFQYGTSLSEPRVPADPVPEPASAMLIGSGMIGLSLLGRRLRKKG
jgi:hypothetical protein